MTRDVTISVAHGNVIDYSADVLVLKFAQGLYGADANVYSKLRSVGTDVVLPGPRQWHSFRTSGALSPAHVIFVGVEPLHKFDYPQIREFSRLALAAVADAVPTARHVAITLHGPGYGLDEMEAFDSELAGLLDGLRTGPCPLGLTRITFVELERKRAERLSNRLDALLPENTISPNARDQTAILSEPSRSLLGDVGLATARKPRVFVAMPFDEDMEDVYDYGISRPANACGFVCERADREIFTDDIVRWIKDRIASADLMIADVTGANPNVYLEVGYAWGVQKTTILIARSTDDLKFDLKTQRCFVYKSIKSLEQQLTRTLTAFRPGA